MLWFFRVVVVVEEEVLSKSELLFMLSQCFSLFSFCFCFIAIPMIYSGKKTIMMGKDKERHCHHLLPLLSIWAGSVWNPRGGSQETVYRVWSHTPRCTRMPKFPTFPFQSQKVQKGVEVGTREHLLDLTPWFHTGFMCLQIKCIIMMI